MRGQKFQCNDQILLIMSERFEWDDTYTSGIWWSTNVSIRDECILLKEDTQCEDSDIVELLRSIAQNIEENGL